MRKYYKLFELIPKATGNLASELKRYEIRLLLEDAIEKAEKYNEVKPYIPTITEHDIRDYVLYLQGLIGSLSQENLILKAKAEKYNALEEELGCPLEVVFKAIAQGYVYELDDEEFSIGKTVSKQNIEGVSKTHCYTPDFWCLLIVSDNIYYTIRLYDYKKTWWLKEDKSE